MALALHAGDAAPDSGVGVRIGPTADADGAEHLPLVVPEGDGAGTAGSAIPGAVEQGGDWNGSVLVAGMPPQPDILPGVEGLGLRAAEAALASRAGQNQADGLHANTPYETAS